MTIAGANGRTPRHPHVLRCGVVAVAAMLFLLLPAGTLLAQTEPEAPRTPEKLYNGFQISLYGAFAYTHLVGNYSGPCACEFVGNASSWGGAWGGWVNIPIFSDAALYLRFGWRPSSTDWFTSRSDSLHSTPGVGDIGTNLTFQYDMMRLDALFRLIGRMDGERIYMGPSFGFVQTAHVRIVDIELATNKTFVMQDEDLPLTSDLRVSIILGVEYAFHVARNLYLIPALEVDYPFEKLIDDTPPKPEYELRPVFYSVQLSASYQLF
jgi:hypothetical protein